MDCSKEFHFSAQQTPILFRRKWKSNGLIPVMSRPQNLGRQKNPRTTENLGLASSDRTDTKHQPLKLYEDTIAETSSIPLHPVPRHWGASSTCLCSAPTE